MAAGPIHFGHAPASFSAWPGYFWGWYGFLLGDGYQDTLPQCRASLVGTLAEELTEDAAYAPYLARQEAELRDLRSSEGLELAVDFPFAEVPGLSNEMVERLSAAQPRNLAAAGRIRGITPAALAALLVHAKRRNQAA